MSDVKNARSAVSQFVQKAPNAVYTLDSERDAPESEICRKAQFATPEQQRECRRVQLHATALFATMQDLGFFCALPQEPGRTYIECKPLPKELK